MEDLRNLGIGISVYNRCLDRVERGRFITDEQLCIFALRVRKSERENLFKERKVKMEIKRVPFLGKIINFILRGTNIMNQIEDATQTLVEVNTALAIVDSKLDDIALKLNNINPDNVSLADIESLKTAVANIKTETASIKDKTIALDPDAPPAVEPGSAA